MFNIAKFTKASCRSQFAVRTRNLTLPPCCTYGTRQSAIVKTFFDNQTNTAQYVLVCPNTKKCAIIDSVLEYNPNSSSTSIKNASKLIEYINSNHLKTEWILETHAHADHITASAYLQQKLQGKLAIGSEIKKVQSFFKQTFDLSMKTDGSQFDFLLQDGGVIQVGDVDLKVIHTPGHTPSCVSYYVQDDCIFVGDTLFMPDQGTARCDFPMGSAAALWDSIQKILSLPGHVRVFTCHDYQPGGREVKYESTIEEQRRSNIHVKHGTTKDQFIRWRKERDATLEQPRLIIPAIQVNINAGRFPRPASNGISYLKLPVNVFVPNAIGAVYEEPTNKESKQIETMIHKVSPDVWTAGHLLDETQLKDLSKQGIKTVFTVASGNQDVHAFDQIATSLGMKSLSCELDDITNENLLDELLYEIDDSYKPVLIHGSKNSFIETIGLIYAATRYGMSDQVLGQKLDEAGLTQTKIFALSYVAKRTSQQAPKAALTQVSENLWIAPQVDEDMLASARNVGIRTVINIRMANEQGFLENERELVENLGMSYHHHPLKATNISQRAIDELMTLIDKAEKPVLLHCRRMNRSAALSALYYGYDSSTGTSPVQILKDLEAKGAKPYQVPGLTEFVSKLSDH